MNIIVAADKKNGIGYQGKLLVTIPFDQQLFRKETIGKIVVMGRKTLESLPGGRVLEGRTNIVLTRNPDYTCKGAIICHSVEEVLEQIKQYRSEDVYVIGGESVYREFLPYADRIHLTRIDYVYEADTFFPEISFEEWILTDVSDEQTYFDLVYDFRCYEKKQK
jgi:dihydrofolate reductase